MRKILLLLLCLYCFGFISFGQNSTNKYAPTHFKAPTNKERYKKDYELVDENLLGQDSLILNQMNILTIDSYREDIQDVVFIYKELNISVKVYSRERAKNNKAYITEPMVPNH